MYLYLYLRYISKVSSPTLPFQSLWQQTSRLKCMNKFCRNPHPLPCSPRAGIELDEVVFVLHLALHLVPLHGVHVGLLRGHFSRFNAMLSLITTGQVVKKVL